MAIEAEQAPTEKTEPAGGQVNSPSAASQSGSGDSAKPVAARTRRPRKRIDLGSKEYFFNRELTWLNFNRRVLHEAQDRRTKLLERLKFIAIVCSNLDEFFMKRIGGLKQQVGAGLSGLSLDGRTPRQQIDECHRIIKELEESKRASFQAVSAQLSNHGINIFDYDELTKADQSYLREYFGKNIFPLVTPQSIDPAHPFPFISNLSLNLLVRLRQSGQGEIILARVKVPVGHDVPRFLRIKDTYNFVRLEQVISSNLDMLFPKMEVISADIFRVTRNAVTEMDEEQAEDLLEMIETELRYRKFASTVRLQISEGMDPVLRGMIAAELGLDEKEDVFIVPGLMGKSDLMELMSLDLPELKDSIHTPIDHPRLKDKRAIFYKLRDDGPIFLFHPF